MIKQHAALTAGRSKLKPVPRKYAPVPPTIGTVIPTITTVTTLSGL